MRLSAIIAAALALGAGCAADEEAPELVADLDIGGASADGIGFVEIADGSDVQLIAGSQGGFHVWTGVRLRGAAGELYLDREARLVSDGTVVLSAPGLYLDVPPLAPDEWWQRQDAAPSFMCPAPVGIRLDGVEIELKAEIRDESGELLAEDRLVITPVCPGGDLADFCHSICEG